jgi:hypothetical protein
MSEFVSVHKSVREWEGTLRSSGRDIDWVHIVDRHEDFGVLNLVFQQCDADVIVHP